MKVKKKQFDKTLSTRLVLEPDPNLKCFCLTRYVGEEDDISETVPDDDDETPVSIGYNFDKRVKWTSEFEKFFISLITDDWSTMKSQMRHFYSKAISMFGDLRISKRKTPPAKEKTTKRRKKVTINEEQHEHENESQLNDYELVPVRSQNEEILHAVVVLMFFFHDQENGTILDCCLQNSEEIKREYLRVFPNNSNKNLDIILDVYNKYGEKNLLEFYHKNKESLFKKSLSFLQDGDGFDE